MGRLAQVSFVVPHLPQLQSTDELRQHVRSLRCPIELLRAVGKTVEDGVKVEATVPMAPDTSADAVVRSVSGSDVTAQPFASELLTTSAGWQATLREYRLGGHAPARVGVADFLVHGERCFLIATVADAEPRRDESWAAARSFLARAVPVWRGNLLLDDLLWLPQCQSRARVEEPALDAAFFNEWERRWSRTGVEWRHRTNPTRGVVLVHFSLAPVMSCAELLHHHLDSLLGQCERVEQRHAERGTTSEGEHYGLFAVGAQGAAGSFERRIGVVYGERYMALVEGHFIDGDQAASFRIFIDRLVRGFRLRDGGHARFRRVAHGCPVGWAVRTRDLTTHLLAPDGRSFITVLPAQPMRADSIAQKFTYEDVLVRFTPTARIETRLHTTPSGLRGELVTVRGTTASYELIFTTALFRDESFDYIIRYQRPAPTSASDDEFIAVVDSLKPVPAAKVPSSEPVLNSAYWTD